MHGSCMSERSKGKYQSLAMLYEAVECNEEADELVWKSNDTKGSTLSQRLHHAWSHHRWCWTYRASLRKWVSTKGGLWYAKWLRATKEQKNLSGTLQSRKSPIVDWKAFEEPFIGSGPFSGYFHSHRDALWMGGAECWLLPKEFIIKIKFQEFFVPC